MLADISNRPGPKLVPGRVHMQQTFEQHVSGRATNMPTANMTDHAAVSTDPGAARQLLGHGRERVNCALEDCLVNAEGVPEGLLAAMRYAVLGNGKRLRPALVYATGGAMGAADDRLDGPACAVELIHAYSLVHDDLPAMDDDDLRRGVPTCHRQFNEATAILTGDALQTLAFEVLAGNVIACPIPAASRNLMISRLAAAAGAAGMAGGQAIDLDLETGRAEVSLEQLENMHRHKTGALIRASVALGALAAGVGDEPIERLDRYGQAIGLAFQIVDDILDVTAETETLGKTQGADHSRGMPTYPALLGLAASRNLAAEQRDAAIAALDGMGDAARPLRALACFVVDRSW